MKLFLSWSGLRSRKVADVLHKWLPGVMNAIEPWLSTEDLQKGSRWQSEIGKQLQLNTFGVVCLTRENLESPWIHFECGALSKAVGDSLVFTYLLGVNSTEITGPLAMFNHTTATKDDTFRLLRAINAASGALNERTLTPQQLEHSFQVWWPELERELAAVASAPQDDENSPPSDRELMAELVTSVRSLDRRVSQLVSSIAMSISSASRFGDRLPIGSDVARVYDRYDGSDTGSGTGSAYVGGGEVGEFDDSFTSPARKRAQQAVEAVFNPPADIES